MPRALDRLVLVLESGKAWREVLPLSSQISLLCLFHSGAGGSWPLGSCVEETRSLSGALAGRGFWVCSLGVVHPLLKIAVSPAVRFCLERSKPDLLSGLNAEERKKKIGVDVWLCRVVSRGGK